MTCEKTYLFGEVYPKLKEYCREKYGMEFQVRLSHFLQSAINSYQSCDHFSINKYYRAKEKMAFMCAEGDRKKSRMG